MLESTRSLLFRSTNMSASFKNFNISQPRTLSPRESKQLLNILTNSFRQQLDREHGHAFRPEETRHLPVKRSRPSHSNPPTGAALPNMLIQSILTNPLLSNTPQKPAKHVSVRDPVEIFDDAQAKGFMTYELAAKCLEAKKNQIIQSSELSVREGMKASGLGRKVLRWLLSTSTVQDFPFVVKGSAFTRPFFEFLVAENLHAAIWPWIEQCIGWVIETRNFNTLRSRSLEDMVYLFVRAEYATGFPDQGFTVLITASKLMRELEYPARGQKLLSRAAGMLLRGTTRRVAGNASSNYALPSAEIYESFIEMLAQWDCPLATAHLWLEHPTKPNTSYALEVLKSVNHPLADENLTDQDRYFQNRWGMEHIALLGMATARRLLETDQHADAMWIIHLLQENYAEVLGVQQKEAVEQAKAEAASLELLDNLQLV